jgi:diguanylate cyclase (GGDEF)-like protein
MHQLVDHLTQLSAHRDRDVLDATLVMALRELLQPQGLAIYHSVGNPGDERWLTRARLQRGDVAPSVDAAWNDLEGLPEVVSHPQRLLCLVEATVSEVPAASPGTPHVTIFPLVSDHEVVGTLDVQSEGPLTTEQRHAVESVLRFYRNFQAVLDYGERDTLTGLLNRKTFDETFHKIALQPARGDAGTERRKSGAPRLWLAVLDVDHFKQVNDRFGHLIGDEVLLLIARLMRSSFRIHDQLYRFGGEEFIVMMRCPDAEAALAALERFRSNVAAYAFPQAGQVTVSLGFTEVQTSDAPSTAFERADKAVYFAKQAGRNRVAHHEALVAGGAIAASERAGGDVELF